MRLANAILQNTFLAAAAIVKNDTLVSIQKPQGPPLVAHEGVQALRPSVLIAPGEDCLLHAWRRPPQCFAVAKRADFATRIDTSFPAEPGVEYLAGFSAGPCKGRLWILSWDVKAGNKA